MYQIKNFHKMPEANAWLSTQKNIEVIEHNIAYTPYGVLVITVLYKLVDQV